MLWPYQTTGRTPTGETPFKLAFSIEAVIPTEVRLSSLRRAHYDENSNNEELRLSLDYLSKVKDEAAQRLTQYQQKMAKHHDLRVRLRRFNPNDMVLQKVS